MVKSGQKLIEVSLTSKDYIRTLFNFLIYRKSPFGMKRFSIKLVLVEARMSRRDSDNIHKTKVNSVLGSVSKFRNQKCSMMTRRHRNKFCFCVGFVRKSVAVHDKVFNLIARQQPT